LLLLIVMLTVLPALSTNAQTPMSFSGHAGYSWLSGVLGADLQFGNFEISGGWFPTKMPMSGERVQNISFAVTANTLKPSDEGEGYYLTLASASHGYRYEDSWGGESSEPMMIIAGGMRYQLDGVWSKLGVGYGWCDAGSSWTFEIMLGFCTFLEI
jgi:hypothetical protein